MTDPASTGPYTCSSCSASYVRLDHLRRHETKHEGQRLYACEFCNSPYQRRDILRRHYKTCKLRGDRPVPGPQKRGRRRQACDRCATFKLACDLDRPCQACASSNSTCSWNRVQTKNRASTPVANRTQQNDMDISVASPSSGSSSSFPETIAAAAPEPQPSLSIHESFVFSLQKMSVPFLINFVSSDSMTFPDTFGYTSIAPEPLPKPSRPASTNRSSREFLSDRGASDLDMSGLRPILGYSSNTSHTSLFDDLTSNGLDVSSQRSVLDAMSVRATFGEFQMANEPNAQNMSIRDGTQRRSESMERRPIPSDASTSPDPTKARISELVMQLADIYITLPKAHPARAPNVRIEDIDSFFTVSNLRTFSQIYFHHFHPHCPIIHRPSFDLKTVSLRLVLVIFLAGALYSSTEDAVVRTRGFLDIAEEYVFQNPYFERLHKRHCWKEPIQACDEQLQAVQAALTMVFLQNWEGNDTARHRIRVERFSSIVSSARALRLTNTQNQLLSHIQQDSPHLFNWQSFARNEERLRLIYYVFILDNIFSVFHNSPPRLALVELTADMPCREETFTATSSADCFQSACDEKFIRPPPMGKLLKLLLSEEENLPSETELISLQNRLTTLHLFIIIIALHTLLHTSRQNHLHLLPAALPTIDRALERWEALWTAHCRSGIPPRQFKKLGFVKNGLDFWWLAKLFVYVGGLMPTDAPGDDDRGVEGGESGGGDGGDAVLGLGLGQQPVVEDDDMSFVRNLIKKYCLAPAGMFCP